MTQWNLGFRPKPSRRISRLVSTADSGARSYSARARTIATINAASLRVAGRIFNKTAPSCKLQATRKSPLAAYELPSPLEMPRLKLRTSSRVSEHGSVWHRERRRFYYSGGNLDTHGDVMARISYIEPAQAPPEVKEIYDTILKGKPGSIQKALAHRPEILKNFLAFYSSVGRHMERRLYELVYLRVSMINQCHY